MKCKYNLNPEEDVYIMVPDDESYDLFLKFLEKEWPKIYDYFIENRIDRDSWNYIIIEYNDIHRSNETYSEQVFEISELRLLYKVFNKLNDEI